LRKIKNEVWDSKYEIEVWFDLSGDKVGLSIQLELVLLSICMEPNSALEACHRLKVERVLRL